MVVSESALIDQDTQITHVARRSGGAEFSFDNADLILEATAKGLRRLADVVNEAVINQTGRWPRRRGGRGSGR
jgi:hypothetical protein